ncbi:SusC/RagA family TonB-linked outer membrane protein [Sphingobacterium haloxyli]|uniref:SusC/RagA family TonB-linked outer membrane protein n=1 Tax=Sphingobacterium haloxyli TaxID=2100533 RepID=A0A2S9J2A8_9SPHI|nr:SusC/RagA family TonB-linked outer membrane protein [Sphingobacterium haloxyli]PRD46915.1 SusC/RagA family TonB-linked outer membrane protein [Sphingobacterium haloxyli]
MIRGLLLFLGTIILGTVAHAQLLIKGTVVDSLNNTIAEVTVAEKGQPRVVRTNEAGEFEINTVANKGTLVFSHVGYRLSTQDFHADVGQLKVKLETSAAQIEEVTVSTGYQNIPKERSTGSFSVVGEELFNQQVGTDILSRLPSIANSIVMDNGNSSSGQMMVRGLSTINGPKDPLIVVDNFPYDGDINNINPNIVESITILKDAAASSIWGARAANGVVVITTKTGKYNQPIRMEFNSNLTVGDKPDLYYIPQMSSADFIDVESELYERGFYNSKINAISKPIISPVIDLLDQMDNGIISSEEARTQIHALRNIDARDQFVQSIYKPSFNQQYFLSANGGSRNFSWLSSIGYDRNKQTLGDTYQRINLRFQNTYQVTEGLSIGTNIYYTQAQNNSGRYGYNDVPNLLPYLQIADTNGDALPIPRDHRHSFIRTYGNGKLLDWNYYPLTDWQHHTSRGHTSDVLANLQIRYEVLKGLMASVNYQYERQNGLSTNLSDENSYAARDYVNRFTQISGEEVTYIVPKGGIMDKSNRLLNANNLRGQLSFSNTYDEHQIDAIGGMEIRRSHMASYSDRFYGYNPNNLTFANMDYTRSYPNVVTGGGAFIHNNQTLGDVDTRFVSQFANFAYTYRGLYTLSGSARRDASNLFGLKTNDQWNPFWSIGGAWKLSNENFYHLDFLPYLNLRATYGFSGNVDPGMVAVNTIRFMSPSVFTRRPSARFDNYYNPHLRWETSKMLNLAIDFRSKSNRITGSVEYFLKNGENLFGRAPIDYTTGVSRSILRNVANMQGTGWDFEIRSENLNGGFKWNTLLNLSLYRDEIIDYHLERTLAQEYVNTYSPPISGIEGKPVYAIYAYKWAGLDPVTGEAQGYLRGEVSKDYTAITGVGTSVDELEYYGSAIPTKYGNMINSFSYKDFNLQIGLTYKFGYWFRRRSINYTELFNNWRGHSDYAKRWKTPGDELITNVPVNQYTTNSNRDRFYEGSNVLVEKGDHIRLQYINVGYDFKRLKSFKSFQVYVNIHNIGVIWKANKANIDPDFNIGLGRVVNPTNYSFGIRAGI